MTAYHTIYDHLRTQKVAPDGQSAVLTNEMQGHATGIEMWGNWQVSPRWRLAAGYTALRERFRLKAGSEDFDAPQITAGSDPANTWQLRSTFQIAENRDLTLNLRHAAKLTSLDTPAYTAIDARFAWRLRPNLELSVSGQNILGTDHAEYGSPMFRGRVPSQVFIRLVWRQ